MTAWSGEKLEMDICPIKKRLVVYHSQTSPLIDWYKNDGKYQHINGLGTMEGIFAEIAEAIDKVK